MSSVYSLGYPASRVVASSSVRVLFFILLHIPLAFAFGESSLISTTHALATFGLGLLWLARDRRPHRLIYLTAYIAGSELLWRGTNASVFWEFGKYSLSLLLILTLLKFRGLSKGDKKPAIYFVLLLPSILVMPAFNREEIAFNLTGPFSLAVASLYFSGLKLSQHDIRQILTAALAPIVGLGFLAVFQTVGAEQIVFTGDSTRLTAAGIGPNQVSSVLGMGGLLAFLLVFVGGKQKTFNLFMVSIAVWLLVQSALTFSRGGFWTTLGALAAGAYYLLQNRRSRHLFLVITLVLIAISYFLIVPALEEFTSGTIVVRFQDFDPTGRDRILASDILAFRENPVFGVGPGQSQYHHNLLYRLSAAHIEYSRMLAEHGSFGLLALIILAVIVVQRMFADQPPLGKALVASFTVWALLFMAHSATRLVAPGYLFGLAAARYFVSHGTSET